MKKRSISKVISQILVFSMLLALSVFNVFAADYQAQGVLPEGASETNEIYMVTADDSITTESEDPYYYNVIGEKFNYAEDIEFKFEFGGAGGTNNVPASEFKGKIAIYADAELTTPVAEFSDSGVLTMTGPSRGKSHLHYSRGVTATLVVPANTLDAETEYYLVFDDTIGYRNVTIGKDIVFKFTTLGDPSKVAGVALDQSALLFDGMGLSYDLTETVNPASAVDKTVSFESSNPAVATVDEEGKITSVANGSATITVATTDGSFTATCEVTVVDRGTNDVYYAVNSNAAEYFGGNNAAFKFVGPTPIYRGISNTNQMIYLNEYKFAELPDFKITCVPSGGQKSTKVYLDFYTVAGYKADEESLASMTHIGYDGTTPEAIQDVKWVLSAIESDEITDAEQYCIVIDSTTSSGSNVVGEDIVINIWTVCEHSKAISVEGKEPTCLKSGLTDGTYCEYCDLWVVEQEEIAALGHNHVDGVCTRCGDVNYVITQGDKANYKVDSEENLSFTVNGAFGKFKSVRVDGKEVDKSNYTVKEGSTIVTFTAKYLATLEHGEHKLEVVYTDGVVEGTFFVEHLGTEIPNTADTVVILPFAMTCLASCAGVIATDKKRRKV